MSAQLVCLNSAEMHIFIPLPFTTRTQVKSRRSWLASSFAAVWPMSSSRCSDAEDYFAQTLLPAMLTYPIIVMKAGGLTRARRHDRRVVSPSAACSRSRAWHKYSAVVVLYRLHRRFWEDGFASILFRK